MSSRVLRSALALALVGGAWVGGCGNDQPRAEIIYKVGTSAGGEPPDLPQVRRGIERRLAEAGFERIEVRVMGEGRVRVVFPEAELSRLPEARRALEKDNPLGVSLTVE